MTKKTCVLTAVALLLATSTPAAAVPPPQLVITEAVTSSTDGIITIVGRNFGSDTPTVSLAGVDLTVQTSDGFEIVADLPASFGPGNYTLVVSRGPATVQRDDFELSIGSASSPGEGTVTQIDTGTGLLGGPITDSGTIELDLGFLDGTYLRLDGLNNGPFARRDEPNNLTGDQITDGIFAGRQVVGSNPDSWGQGVVGSADHPDYGVGVQGVLNSTEGYALYGHASQGSGNTRAVFAEVFSPDGTAGFFVNGGGGTILSGHTFGEAQVFSVEADGSIFSQGNVNAAGQVHAAGYFINGNPIGLGDVTAAWPGPGLAGGGDFGDVTLEIDEGYLDGLYVRTDGANGGLFARLDQENYFSHDQYVPSLFASSQVVATNVAATELSAEVAVLETFTPGYTTLIVKQSAPHDGNAISAEANGENQTAVSAHAGSPTGYNIALWGKVESPDATAAVFENNADGRLISASTPTYGEVFSLGGEGRTSFSTPFTPNSMDQIFVVDVLATAASGHVRGINSTTFSPGSFAVVGSAQPATGGTGGSFDTYGDGGTGVWAGAQASTGTGKALLAQNWSPDGIAGQFDSLGDGQILSGNSNTWGEVFRVQADGTVQANAYTDLFGNPIGNDGVGVFEVETGIGLTGGPITTSGTIEIDFNELDGQYARLDTENFFSQPQHAPNLAASNSLVNNVVISGEATGAGSSGVGGYGIENGITGEAYEPVNWSTGVIGRAYSPQGIGISGSVDPGSGAGGLGVLGWSAGTNGRGGEFIAGALTGNGVGANGITMSPDGIGLRGIVDAGGSSGNGVAVEGVLNAESGSAGRFFATSPTGSTIGLNVDVLSPNGLGAQILVDSGRILSGQSIFGEVFTVDADGTVTGAAFVSPSSERFKTNIASLDGALETIQSLRGVSFEWRRDGRHDIGLIAEEVAEVLPEVVASASGEVQGVDYSRLTAVLVEAVKEQQQQIDELEAIVASLLAARQP